MKRSFIVYPWLVAVYPVIALLAWNIEAIRPLVVLRALFACCLAALILLALARLWLKSTVRASALTGVLLLLFFAYGHVYNLLKLTPYGRHQYILPVWLVLVAASLLLFSRPLRFLPSLTSPLNWMALALLLLPLGQIGIYEFRTWNVRQQSADRILPGVLSAQPAGPLPDVYYIILDAYTRQDAMQRIYGLDNSPFLTQLEDLGFYIARCAQSNYAQTQLSLASSLNMDYLPALGDEYTPQHTTRTGILELIEHNAVRHTLEQAGYRTIAFETGFEATQWQDAAFYFSPAATWLNRLELGQGLNAFEVMFLRSTALLALTDAESRLPRILQPDLDNPRRIHYQRILFVLDKMLEIPRIPGPKFVFVHLVTPHPPYVFDARGEYQPDDREDAAGYRDQVTYINSRLLPILQEIMAQSPVMPVIIIQGDHGGIGAPPAERMQILNAYLLPAAAGDLHPSVSPVNSFRLFFNAYFRLDLPLHQDAAYYSDYRTPFEFTPIPNSAPACP